MNKQGREFNKHRISTYVLILIGIFFGIMLVSAIDSSEIDDLCASNNMVLFRYNGTWGCGNLSNVVYNYTTNNITNIIQNYSIYSSESRSLKTPFSQIINFSKVDENNTGNSKGYGFVNVGTFYGHTNNIYAFGQNLGDSITSFIWGASNNVNSSGIVNFVGTIIGSGNTVNQSNDATDILKPMILIGNDNFVAQRMNGLTIIGNLLPLINRTNYMGTNGVYIGNNNTWIGFNRTDGFMNGSYDASHFQVGNVNVCLQNGSDCMSIANQYDQTLNTTNNVTFGGINVSNEIFIGGMNVPRVMWTSNGTVTHNTTQGSGKFSPMQYGRGNFTLPGKFCLSGRTGKLSLQGLMKTAAVTVPGDALQVQIYLGSTIIWDTGEAAIINTNAWRNFGLDVTFTCIDDWTVGNGTIQVAGYNLRQGTALTAINMLPSANGTLQTIDMQIPQLINITARFNGTSYELNLTNTQIMVLN